MTTIYPRLNRKMTSIALAIALSASCTGLQAAEADTSSAVTDTKRGALFAGSTIAGAALGGPVGFVLGAMTGAWLGEEVREADQLEQAEAELASLNEDYQHLQQQLADSRAQGEALAQMTLEQLALEMLFTTGKSELTTSANERLAALADFLRVNTDLAIRLDGYSDPRGERAYNQALSEQRVKAVAEFLTGHGIEEHRITQYSHGASQSKANSGDYDAYALERRVRIQLQRDGEQVAQINL